MINIAIRCRDELGWLSFIYNAVFQTLLFVFELWLNLSVVDSLTLGAHAPEGYDSCPVCVCVCVCVCPQP